MAITKNEIETLIKEALPDAKVEIKDLVGDSNDSYLTLEPKGSLYRIVSDTFKKDKDKDYRWWGHCMWEYSILNINENEWKGFRVLW